MSVADASPTSSSKTASHNRRARKSLSNRFSSFLSPKSSHTNSFSIDLDNPLKTYGPGDAVRGKVILDVARPLGVTHVVVSLRGYVQVFKNHAKSRSPQPSNGGRAATGRGKRWVSEYYGDGYMSLFEEEIVLCGEGRLDPTYSPFHFHFNLEFPSELALPSSIDFERGTIAYLVTATMTRPAYTAPTMSCDTRVVFLEDIDVASLSSPKPREVTLRPEQRAGSPRSSLKRLASYDVKRSHRNSTVSTALPSNKSAVDSVPVHADSSSVRAPSASIASTRSSSSGHNRASVAPSEPRSSHTSPSLNGESHRPAKNITASAELCKSGCLPGQIVPLLVKINHNKVVQNPAGILVTLYRQARVDMHPHLPLASSDNGIGTRYEDYYPRSKTGLGGLSLSAAGSSQVWRKDLSQTTAPLYIDDKTMAQEIRVGIRVPDLPGAFPSIRNVPGQMISFRYIVEVVIDIHGKLIGHDRAHSASNAVVGAPQPYYINSTLPTSDGGDRPQSTTYELRCMDTTQLRRDKYAVTVECELVVGTRDSSSSKGKQREHRPDLGTSSSAQHTPSPAPAPNQGQESGQDGYHYSNSELSFPEEEYEWLSRWDEDGQRWLYIDEWGNVYDEAWNFLGYDYPPPTVEYNDGQLHREASTLVPPPQFSDGQELSEKQRLRLAEESLLPSRPPIDTQPASPAVDNDATAPDLPEESSLYIPEAESSMANRERSASVVQDFACNPSTQLDTPISLRGGEELEYSAIAESDPVLPSSNSVNQMENQGHQPSTGNPTNVLPEATAADCSGTDDIPHQGEGQESTPRMGEAEPASAPRPDAEDEASIGKDTDEGLPKYQS